MGYITLRDIGKVGNLGSQLQQYLCLYAISKEKNKKLVFPESSIHMGFGFKFANILDISIELMPDSFFDSFIDLHVDYTKVLDTALLSQIDDKLNYNINGRFDLFHYWYPKYINDILDLNWNKQYYEIALKQYNEILSEDKETVAIHVRRGDYLLPSQDHYCKLDNFYYQQAIKDFLIGEKKYHFVVFSNDIDWCKNNFIQKDSVTFVETGMDYVDLILMSLCNHFIIANSSYSWFAAIKSNSKNKKVYCPKNYLKQDNMLSHINGNYYPDNWKSIENTCV